MRRLAILVLACSAAAPAGAQPTTRYPKPPVDEDRAREQRSELWGAATHPAKQPYEAALSEARQKRDQGDYAGAITVADRAIALLPELPDAYELRGDARLRQRTDWAGCADDLAAALARHQDEQPDDDGGSPPGVSGAEGRRGSIDKNLRKDLGVCQARAGRLGDAEVTLTDAASLAPKDWEIWKRLGEVRVAMGKLDEAIAAYDSALAEGISESQTLWQRAGAYDRARQPSRAEDDVHAAMLNDRMASQIDRGDLPLLGTDDSDFLHGMAWQYAEAPRVEAAIAYFRHFVATAPTSPWRRRADEHLRELAAVPLPQTVVHTGNAPLDIEAATKIVQEAMPRLRACLVKAPGVVLDVRITRTGPKAPPPKPGERIHFRAPPPGVQTTPQLDFDAKPGAVDDATRCLEPIADKLPLPPVKEKETFYQVSFSVVAP
jgi:tetratricopeptide (TPR) repeat protein